MKKVITKIITIILFLFFLATFIYSSYRIIDWKNNNKKNKQINEITHEYITTDSDEKFKIDFDKLKEMNPDTVAYIKVNNTNIDYIVVKGENNDYYLDHNFNKEMNKSGWVFMDYNNKLDGQDKNIIIYAHNTIDKSMFGSLKDVLDKSWYENKDNHTIMLVTPDDTYMYQVFSTYKIDNEEYYIQTGFKSDSEYLDFLKTIKKRSKYNYDVELSESDQILTLSTCANNGAKRVVLHAKKIVQ